MKNFVYTSSNVMVWEYRIILNRAVSKLNSIKDGAELQQDVAVVILLSVMVVEVFLNMFFQQLITYPLYEQHKDYIKNTLNRHVSIEQKITKWPVRFFNKKFDLEHGIGKEFTELKNLRNHLMHFSAMDIVTFDGHDFTTKSDVNFYDQLKLEDALHAVNVVDHTILELLRISGYTDDLLDKFMFDWTGQKISTKDSNRRYDK